MDVLLQNVVQELGCEMKSGIHCELYKLLLHQSGGFFNGKGSTSPSWQSCKYDNTHNAIPTMHTHNAQPHPQVHNDHLSGYKR